MKKVYLLQFFCYNYYDLIVIGVYSSIKNILQIDTKKEFEFSDGEYRIVEFEINSIQSKTLKTKMVSSKGAEADWQDKVD